MTMKLLMLCDEGSGESLQLIPDTFNGKYKIVQHTIGGNQSCREFLQYFDSSIYILHITSRLEINLIRFIQIKKLLTIIAGPSVPLLVVCRNADETFTFQSVLSIFEYSSDLSSTRIVQSGGEVKEALSEYKRFFDSKSGRALNAFRVNFCDIMSKKRSQMGNILKACRELSSGPESCYAGYNYANGSCQDRFIEELGRKCIMPKNWAEEVQFTTQRATHILYQLHVLGPNPKLDQVLAIFKMVSDNLKQSDGPDRQYEHLAINSPQRQQAGETGSIGSTGTRHFPRHVSVSSKKVRHPQFNFICLAHPDILFSDIEQALLDDKGIDVTAREITRKSDQQPSYLVKTDDYGFFVKMMRGGRFDCKGHTILCGATIARNVASTESFVPKLCL
eukprot:757618_1